MLLTHKVDLAGVTEATTMRFPMGAELIGSSTVLIPWQVLVAKVKLPHEDLEQFLQWQEFEFTDTAEDREWVLGRLRGTIYGDEPFTWWGDPSTAEEFLAGHPIIPVDPQTPDYMRRFLNVLIDLDHEDHVVVYLECSIEA